MRVVIIGSGGREHAIAWKVKQSPLLTELYVLPGNPGTSQIAININIGMNDFNGILAFCIQKKIDLIIIGPEAPLVNGLTDLLLTSGFNVFGPTTNAARIEGDKAFAKRLMEKNLIPSASFKVFEKSKIDNSIEYLKSIQYPAVIKATGLAAGKGVIICNNFTEAKKAIEDCFIHNIFGSAGERIVIEEYLEGEEASIFAITDGTDFVILPAAQDHKRIYDNDKGPNTGGMGAYAPAPLINEDNQKQIIERIINPTIEALKKENSKFIGCLYCGLMITKDGPKVIEFNCRFGDPETQVVLPLLKGDFLELLYSAAIEKLQKNTVRYNGGCSVCVITASEGYPGIFQIGFNISGMDGIKNPKIVLFHSGTKLDKNVLVTNGGRVLGITGVNENNDLRNCISMVYTEIQKIKYEGIFYRKDIGKKAESDNHPAGQLNILPPNK